eukprot:4621869-Amphidinium_carterae.1
MVLRASSLGSKESRLTIRSSAVETPSAFALQEPASVLLVAASALPTLRLRCKGGLASAGTNSGTASAGATVQVYRSRFLGMGLALASCTT